MEAILRICISELGTDKVQTILNEYIAKPKSVSTTESITEAVVKSKAEPKRIPRMSPTLATQLKAELKKVGVECEDKKDFEKVKNELS